MENQMITWIAIVGVVAVIFLIRVFDVLRAFGHNKKHHIIEMGSDAELFGVQMPKGEEEDEDE